MPGRQGGPPAALPPHPPFLLLLLLVAAAAVAAEVVEVELEVAGGLARRYGGPRQSVLVNGALSGPEIRVRTGDTVRATVRNALLDGGTTVHWHGVLQKGTNFFDGVDGITQCAIPPGETFAYEFLAAPSGTMWYHSHTGSQYSDGLLGPLVVEAAEGSCGIFATGSSAVVEATLLLTDWDSRYSQETLYELMDPEAAAPSGRRRRTAQQAGPEQREGGAPPGWGDIGDWPFEGALANGVALPELPEASSSGSANTSALLEAVGIAGAKRLRVICGTSMQMLAVGFGGTPFTVVGVDNNVIEPVTVTSFQCAAGDRLAVELEAPLAGLVVASVNGAFAYGATAGPAPAVEPVWSRNGACDAPADVFDNTCLTAMYGARGLRRAACVPAPPAAANTSVAVVLGGSMKPYSWWMNANRFDFPVPAMLEANGSASVFPEAPEELGEEPTLATRYVPVALGAVVDVALTNPTKMAHPFHLHGHEFWVLAAGPGPPPDAADVDAASAVLKDNQNVPQGGHAVLRFVADNPGFWFFHCHIDFHFIRGMAVPFKVGTDEEIAAANPFPEGFLNCPTRVP